MSLHCPSCRADSTDGLLCEPCTNAADTAAIDLTVLLPALQDAACGLGNATRWRDRRPDRSLELAAAEATEARAVPAPLRSRGGQIALPETPLPNIDAAGLLTQAVGELRAALGPLRAGPRTADSVVRDLLAVYADRKWWTHWGAPGYARIVRHWAGRLVQVLDSGVPDMFLGTCDVPDVRSWFDPQTGAVAVDTGATCGTDLYARFGDTDAVCQACGSVYDVGSRREWMVESVRAVLARPAVIARALSTLDLQVTPAQLDVWIARDKRLHEQGRPRRDGLPLILPDPVVDEAGKPLYRVGDVIDRVTALRAERSDGLSRSR